MPISAGVQRAGVVLSVTQSRHSPRWGWPGQTPPIAISISHSPDGTCQDTRAFATAYVQFWLNALRRPVPETHGTASVNEA